MPRARRDSKTPRYQIRIAVAAGQPWRTLPGGDDQRAAVSAARKHSAAGPVDGVVQVVDTASGEVLHAITRPPIGRPPRAAAAGKPITIRASDEERARWTAAAKREQRELSDWLRAAAELAIARGSTR
jgi:hypothetical protein